MKTLTATFFLIVSTIYLVPNASGGAATLTPVMDNDWGLKIVVFNVGQGDGTLLLTPNGQAVIIDMGRKKEHGERMASFLLNQNENGVASIDTVEFVFASHYDRDHIAGARGLKGKIKVKAAFDQGPSAARNPNAAGGDYTAYVKYVGDKNGNGIKNTGENNFVRHKAEPGQEFTIGQNGNVTIRILSVRGDTSGTAHDFPLTPNTPNFNENPGSIIQLVTLGDFEYLTTGDASSDDFKSEPDTEEAVILANAIPGGHDIDVLKVAHHGSDTSSGQVFIQSTRPEVAIISSDRTGDRLPKLTSIKVLEQNHATVLVTGSAKTANGQFHQSLHPFDNGYTPTNTTDMVGTITVLVSTDGSKYTARSESNPQLTITRSSTDQ